MDVRRLGAPGVADDFPRIAGRLIGVNENDATRALCRPDLVLVGPAPVVGAGLSLEEIRLGGIGRRVVNGDDQRLASRIGALVGVPLLIKAKDAGTNANRLRGAGR